MRRNHNHRTYATQVQLGNGDLAWRLDFCLPNASGRKEFTQLWRLQRPVPVQPNKEVHTGHTEKARLNSFDTHVPRHVVASCEVLI